MQILPYMPDSHKGTFTKVEKLHHLDKNTSMYVVKTTLVLLGLSRLSRIKFTNNIKALGIIRLDMQVHIWSYKSMCTHSTYVLFVAWWTCAYVNFTSAVGFQELSRLCKNVPDNMPRMGPTTPSYCRGDWWTMQIAPSRISAGLYANTFYGLCAPSHMLM